MTVFAGSREIRDLYEPVPAGEFRETVTHVFRAIGFDPAAEVIDRLCSQPLGLRYQKWRETANRLEDLNRKDESAQALRRFVFAQQVLIDIPGGSPFDPAEVYPEQFRRIAEFGADGLLQYGKGQCEALRKVCDSLAAWASRQGRDRIAILESPLGNVVPVSVLAQLLHRADGRPDILSLSLPRDTKAITYKEAIESLYNDLADAPRPLIYLDDLITGTRFSKTLRALQAAAHRRGLPPPVAVALVFPSNRPLTETHAAILARAKEEIHANRPDETTIVWQEMPPLPRLRIDSGPPIVYETPVIWGESDLVAGRRRVNLVFNLIEEFRRLHEALLADNPHVRDRLRQLWAEDTTGARFETTDEVLREAIRSASARMDWNTIAERAMEAFPDDYYGRTQASPDLTFAAHRMDWLRRQVLESDATGSHFTWNALHALFLALEKCNGDPRDRDFCYMFYSYNPTLAHLHNCIVRAVSS